MTLRSDGTSPAPSSGGPDPAGGESREVEWQLAAPDLGVVQHWLEQHATGDGLALRPLPPQQLHDTYLDTEDWRVFRAGFALRLRQKEDHAEATLKGLHSARDDVADRRELTEPLSEGRTRALAQATGVVGGRVHAVAGVKPLRTLFEVRTSRQRYALRRRDNAADVAEIALDEAQFSRGNGNGHRRPMILTRVELEAAGRETALLERFAQRLSAECGLRPAKENKFVVGLRSASLEPPAAPARARDSERLPRVMQSGTRAGDFADTTLVRLLSEWQAHEPAARLGEGPEALHALRVTGRRMDIVLRLFSSYLPASLGRGRVKLKRLLDSLGAVRDVDIKLAAVRVFRGQLPEGDQRALAPLLCHLETERAGARSRMLRALDAEPFRRWLETFPEQLARSSPPRSFRSRNADAIALDVVPDLIASGYRKLRKCARRLDSGSSLREYHEVRVRAKKLRYALEVVAPTYRKPADKMLAGLHKLQGKLGTQHDSDVIARYLTRLAMSPPAEFGGQTLFLMGRLAQRHLRNATHMGGKAKKPWRRMRGKRWKALRSRMKNFRDAASKERDRAADADEGSSRMQEGTA